MLYADDLKDSTTCIDDKWVIARPLRGTFLNTVRDAIEVLKGKGDAVKFYKQ